MRPGGTLVLAALWATDAAAGAHMFDHSPLDSLLTRVVTASGDVDYPLLVDQRALLDHYLERLAATSPHSDPQLFPDRAAELAYWLNAYNACVLAAVCDHYPIAGIGEVKGGFLGKLLRIADDKAAFFLVLRFELGGRRTNLYSLEHRVIRPYGDPRIHYALNCASRSCPPLRAQAYDPRRLDRQLDEQQAWFLTLPRGLQITTDRVAVSAIFDWFEKDFVDWLRREHPEAPATLRGYLELVAGPLPAGLELRFADYDWRLNDATRIEPAGDH